MNYDKIGSLYALINKKNRPVSLALKDRQTASRLDIHRVHKQRAFKAFQSWKNIKRIQPSFPVPDKTTAKTHFRFSASHGLRDKGRLEPSPHGPLGVGAGTLGLLWIEIQITQCLQKKTTFTQESSFF